MLGLIGLAVVGHATAQTSPPPAQAPHPGFIAPEAFGEWARSGELNVEAYDFEAAGFFKLSPQERTHWQMGVFNTLLNVGPQVISECSTVRQRNGAAMAWAQIAGQSKDAADWKATAKTIRARLAELDQMLRRSAPAKPSADPLVQELLVRFARDQDVRLIFSQVKWTEGMPPLAANNWLSAAVTRMTAIDCDNTAWLQARLQKIDWFTIPKYGEAADNAAWHLVQHADREPAFQRAMLAKLQALPPGETSGKRLGMLWDRVARAEGKLQRYGTQGLCKDGQWTPYESEDPANLDKRRAALGMTPIAEHMQAVSRDACMH